MNNSQQSIEQPLNQSALTVCSQCCSQGHGFEHLWHSELRRRPYEVP
jgi:hypothetical protein